MGVSILLEKWQCHKCEKGFLLIEEQAKEVEIHCPFCGNTEDVEDVAGQDPNIDYEEEMGCLWPGYNEFDKLAHYMQSGKISKEAGIAYLNARLRGEKQ
ncbi:MAG TPA: hypothetical protein VE710_18320 [Candidatus Bathyarchaeia archaeon]|nr:hypothetical protein [Candidatus Bathyarchaeia archaeon]